MATSPTGISTTTARDAPRPQIWRRIAERPYAPETLLFYSALSLFLLGRNLIGHFSDRYLGVGQDPQLSMFFFEWWRYALANHLNPFNLTAVWYPPGYNLAWTTCVPLAAWTMLPIEATFGPIVAYNIADLLCPAFSAWSAFLLCRYITRSYWAALAGGYIFGFSSYMLCHSLGHLTLTMVFLLPPAVYLVLSWMANKLTDTNFIALFTLVLVGQFLSSLEVLAAMTLAGATFLSLTWLWAGGVLRVRILNLMPRIAASFAILAVLTSPYLYYFFRDGRLSMAEGLAYTVTASPASLFVSVSTNIFGALNTYMGIVSKPSIWEAGEYIGIPLFLVLCSFARTRWNEIAAKALTGFFIVACVATFGPYLMVGSVHLFPLPWLVVTHLPLLHMILPARLSVYIFLDLAIVAAMWLASPKNSFLLRIGAAAAIIVSLLPNMSASYWTSSANTPAFFEGSLFRKYLSPTETVLVLPYGNWGDSDLWLAQTRMYFRMAGGYVNPLVPPNFDEYPIVASFYNLVDIPDADEQLKCFLAQKHVGAVIVADGERQLYRPVPGAPVSSLERVSFSRQEKRTIQALFAGLGVAPIHVGGVSLYRVPLESLRAYATVRQQTLQRRIATIRFTTLIMAANRYLAYGYDPKLLTPLEAQRLGLLPPGWVGGLYELPRYREHIVQDELLLGGDSSGMVAVGVMAPRDVLEPLAQHYSRFAQGFSGAPAGGIRVGNAWLIPPDSYYPSDGARWTLLLEFHPSGLAEAAQAAQRAIVEENALDY
jgi:hypothetical protein